MPICLGYAHDTIMTQPPDSERETKLVKILIYVFYILISILNTYLVILYLLFFYLDLYSKRHLKAIDSLYYPLLLLN